MNESQSHASLAQTQYSFLIMACLARFTNKYTINFIQYNLIRFSSSQKAEFEQVVDEEFRRLELLPDRREKKREDERRKFDVKILVCYFN